MAVRYFIAIFFVSLSMFATGQVVPSTLIEKLNKVHRENRMIWIGKVEEIFINEETNIMDLGVEMIPLHKVSINYEINTKDKKQLNSVKLACATGNCITTHHDGHIYPASALILFFKTKKSCYEFINLIAEVKRKLLIM